MEASARIPVSGTVPLTPPLRPFLLPPRLLHPRPCPRPLLPVLQSAAEVAAGATVSLARPQHAVAATAAPSSDAAQPAAPAQAPPSPAHARRRRRARGACTNHSTRVAAQTPTASSRGQMAIPPYRSRSRASCSTWRRPRHRVCAAGRLSPTFIHLDVGRGRRATHGVGRKIYRKQLWQGSARLRGSTHL